MSDPEIIEPMTVERTLIERTFSVDAEVGGGDGRTIDVRIVPFKETATVADGLGGLPKGVPYQEEWMPGVFGKQENAAHRVLLNFEHEQGLRGIVGHGAALRQASVGYQGTVRLR